MDFVDETNSAAHTIRMYGICTWLIPAIMNILFTIRGSFSAFGRFIAAFSPEGCELCNNWRIHTRLGLASHTMYDTLRYIMMSYSIVNKHI
jgi:hypothetical protein